MRNLLTLSILAYCLLGIGCSPESKTGETELEKAGRHYQAHQDYQSLSKVVELLPDGSDTAFVKSILGEPLDMGFDYRYLIDSAGPNGCVMGAVFHIGSAGKIDQKWLDEICE